MGGWQGLPADSQSGPRGRPRPRHRSPSPRRRCSGPAAAALPRARRPRGVRACLTHAPNRSAGRRDHGSDSSIWLPCTSTRLRGRCPSRAFIWTLPPPAPSLTSRPQQQSARDILLVLPEILMLWRWLASRLGHAGPSLVCPQGGRCVHPLALVKPDLDSGPKPQTMTKR